MCTDSDWLSRPLSCVYWQWMFDYPDRSAVCTDSECLNIRTAQLCVLTVNVWLSGPLSCVYWQWMFDCPDRSAVCTDRSLACHTIRLCVLKYLSCIQTKVLPVLSEHSFSRTSRFSALCNNNFFQFQLVVSVSEDHVYTYRLCSTNSDVMTGLYCVCRFPVVHQCVLSHTEAAMRALQRQSTHSTTWLKLRFCVKRFLSIW